MPPSHQHAASAQVTQVHAGAGSQDRGIYCITAKAPPLALSTGGEDDAGAGSCICPWAGVISGFRVLP